MADDTEGDERRDEQVGPTGTGDGHTDDVTEQSTDDTADGAEQPTGHAAQASEQVIDDGVEAATPGGEQPDSGSAGDTAEQPPVLEAVPDPFDDHQGADDAGAGAGRGDESPWSGVEEPARQFVGSVEGFLGGMFKDAADAMDRLAANQRRPTEQRHRPERPPSGEPPRSADPTQFIDSVEDWLGDFFRGGPVGRAAAGFGKAAAGSAWRSATKSQPDDVWASATAPESHGDASRECRYCPFCQTLAAVRTTRPDLYDQIGDTAKNLVDLVRQAAEQSANRWPRK